MSTLNNGQMLICAIIGVIIAVGIFVCQHTNATPASDPYKWVAECIDQKGQVNVYKGSSGSFRANYDYGYIEVITANHIIKYPAHACTITRPR